MGQQEYSQAVGCKLKICFNGTFLGIINEWYYCDEKMS